MEDLEKEFNRKLSRHELSLGGFDEEGLWEEISNDLVAAKSEVVGSTKHNVFWIGGLVFMSISLVIGGLMLKKSTSVNQETSQGFNTENVLKIRSTDNAVTRQESEIMRDADEIYSGRKAEIVKAVEPVTGKESVYDMAHKRRSNQKVINNPALKSRTDQTAFRNKGHHSAETEVKSSTHTERELVKQSFGEKQIDHQTLMNESKLRSTLQGTEVVLNDDNLISAQEILVVGKLPYENSAIELAARTAPVLTMDLAKPPIVIKDGVSTFKVSLLSGANFTSMHFDIENGDVNNKKNRAEKGDIGMSYALGAEYSLKENWVIQSGLEYHRLWTRLDWKNETTISVYKENHLNRVWVDKISRDTIARENIDTTFIKDQTRTVLHHNKYRQFTLPLMMGWQTHFDKFEFGFRGGLVFNLITAQSGRTLDKNGELQDFKRSDEIAPLNMFSIGYRISPTFSYLFNEQWELLLTPHWNFQRMQRSGAGISSRIQQYGLNLGIRYSVQ